jgi:deoxyhypusine synthase
VDLSSFAKPTAAGSSFRAFYGNLPQILAAKRLHQLVEAIVRAYRKKKPVVAMLGAHVLKVGLSPLIVDWMERKIVTAIATTGSGIIHDFELAYQGKTSEEVLEALADGSFGMAKETADFLNSAIRNGARRGWGLGEAVGRWIEQKRLRYRKLSIFRAAWRCGIPATVHVAIGTDIIHQHPSCDGAAVGKTSLADFRRFTQVVCGVGEEAVVMNIGSAVILPEVFLKAVSIARNLGYPVKGFTAANLDMIQHYRPHQNVLVRPTAIGGEAIALTGHHEILLPILHAAVMERLA